MRGEEEEEEERDGLVACTVGCICGIIWLKHWDLEGYCVVGGDGNGGQKRQG